MIVANLVGLFPTLIAGCGTSFDAVVATAHVGQAIQRHRATFEQTYVTCLEGVALGAVDADLCEKVDAARVNIDAGLGALVAYATSLRAVATGRDADMKDSVAAAAEALPVANIQKSSEEIGSAVGDLVAFITRTLRREALSEIVKDADGSVQGLATAVESAVASWQAVVASMPQDALRLLSKSQDTPERLLLASVAGRLRAQAALLEEAMVSVRAFAAAHATLAKSSDTLGASETVSDVLDAALEVSSAVNELKAPPEEAP